MKKKQISTIIFFTLFFSIIASRGWAKESVAIFGPRFKGVEQGFAEDVFIAFEDGVARSGRFKVMRTGEAMAKWKNTDTELDKSCRNPICLVVIAQKLGVEKILLPYVRMEEGQVLFGYRCFEEINGKFSAENITCLLGEQWQSEMNAFTKRMVAEVPHFGKIKSIKDKTVSIDIGSAQGMNIGSKLKVFRFKDVRAGKRYLFKGETKIGEIKVADTKDDTSTAQITNVSREFKSGDMVLVVGAAPGKFDRKAVAARKKSLPPKAAAVSRKTKDIKDKSASASKKTPIKTKQTVWKKSAKEVAVKKTTEKKTEGVVTAKKKTAPPKAVSKPVKKKVAEAKKTTTKPQKPVKPEKTAKITKPVKPKKVAGKKATEMVFIPAGKFIMGSLSTDPDEKPEREVFVDAYYIDRYEVTNAQYRKFVEATGRFAPDFFDDPDLGKPDHPVVGVSHQDAAAYAEWAGKRLPTEAEWEKSARGTNKLIYPWGNKNNSTRANHTGDKDGYSYTAPVNKLSAGNSPYGVMNMAGNVWEWCADFYQEDFYKKASPKNPKGPQKGNFKVIRGGSWDSNFKSLRTTNRSAADPETRQYDIGFRCAK